MFYKITFISTAMFMALMSGPACTSEEDPRHDTGITGDAGTRDDALSSTEDAKTSEDRSSIEEGGGARPDVDPAGWGCTLEPGGGPFSTVHSDGCRWEWTCPDAGDRELFCETISTAEHTCECKNLTDQSVEQSFRQVDICTYDAQAITAQANQLCGWQL